MVSKGWWEGWGNNEGRMDEKLPKYNCIGPKPAISQHGPPNNSRFGLAGETAKDGRFGPKGASVGKIG